MKGSSEHIAGAVNSLLDFYRLIITEIEVCCVCSVPRAVRKHPCGICRRGRRKGVGTAEPNRLPRGEVSGDALHYPSDRRQLDFQRLKFTGRGSVRPMWTWCGGGGWSSRCATRPRHRPRGGTHLRLEFVRLSSAQESTDFVGAADRRPSVKLLDGTISLESRLGEGEQIHRVGPRRRSGGRECGCRSRRVCVPRRDYACWSTTILQLK